MCVLGGGGGALDTCHTLRRYGRRERQWGEMSEGEPKDGSWHGRFIGPPVRYASSLMVLAEVLDSPSAMRGGSTPGGAAGPGPCMRPPPLGFER